MGVRLATAITVSFVLLVLVACGGGGGAGGGGTAPVVTMITLYHPSGAKRAEGPGYRADGNVVRHGAWTDWFESGVVHMTGTYVDGSLSDSLAWVEYNADSSVRFDWQDY